VIRLDAPLGYVAARNRGIPACSAEVILQLDDDTWPIENVSAAILAEYLLAHPDVGTLAVNT
jgi:glycosyltransferase involved in cell wall biosynthesis